MLQPSAAFMTSARPRLLARWLVAVAALIVAMVVVGGVTRLTESGLSITEWKPLSGIVPPLTHAQWEAEFAGYRRIPQYDAFNRGMTLAGFQAIFFWEYLHRALARVVVTAFALPLLWFAVRRRVPAGYGWRLGAILALLGLQGAVGWWMVASGLETRVEVSHLRLAAHLLLALVTLAATAWVALDLFALARDPFSAPARLTPLAAGALGVLLVQVAWGAFTAGLRAGYAFNSWPLMGDEWFPSATPMAHPLWVEAVNNPIVVQFVHRWTAFLAAAGIVWLAARAARAGAPRAAFAAIALVGLQISLGIATLLSGVALPVAVAHQANAALLLAAAVACAHAVGRASGTVIPAR